MQPQPIFTNPTTTISDAPTPPTTLREPHSRFRDKLQSIIRNPFLLFGFFIAIIIVVVIVSLAVSHWQNSHDNQITINNLNNYVTDVPDTTRAEIYNAAFRAAQSNSAGQTDETLSSADAAIREGSAVSSFNPTTGLYSGNFIVDIPSLKQSYRIYYEWLSDRATSPIRLGDYTTSVTCLHPDEYIYDFYPCIAPNEDVSTTTLSYLNNILPYNGYVNNDTNSDAAIHANHVENTTGGDPFVRVNVNSCGDQSILESGLETFKQYIKDHQLNPDDYTYKLNDLCDGEAG